jgi:hypothetical protein
MEITEDILKEKLTDRKWRINNLYYIKDKSGKKVLFNMNPMQEYLHDNLWYFNIVPKARQLGMTTFFCILYLDQMLFSEHKTAVIIAHRQEDMKKIFRNKIKFAFDNLHPWLKDRIGDPDMNNANELVFKNGSSISVSMTTRSGTVNFLHISEFAYVCEKYPDRADEIVSGAINSVHPGNMVSIESTAAGREGYFFKFCMDAERARLEQRPLSELDFKIFFFPWYLDPEYQLPNASFPFTREYIDYFNLLKQKYNIDLTDGQKRWYMKKKEVNGENMYSEYPSTLDEAFSVSVEGSYYAKEMGRVYLERRITRLPVDQTYDVHTYWDLGMNDYTVIIFAQHVGPIIRIVDVYHNHGEGLAHYVKVLRDKGYRYGRHHLPHDVEVRDLSAAGLTRKQMLYEMGVRDIVVAPKIPTIDGIERVRSIFGRCWFDEEKTVPLTSALGNYRKEWDSGLGVFKDRPRHDESSHHADAMRILGTTYNEPLAEQFAGHGDEYGASSFF